MNIYDEVLIVIGEQSTGDNNEGKVKDMFEYKVLEKAIKRAEKVEELLYWYRENWKSMRVCRLEKKIEKLEKELEEIK